MYYFISILRFVSRVVCLYVLLTFDTTIVYNNEPNSIDFLSGPLVQYVRSMVLRFILVLRFLVPYFPKDFLKRILPTSTEKTIFPLTDLHVPLIFLYHMPSH